MLNLYIDFLHLLNSPAVKTLRKLTIFKSFGPHHANVDARHIDEALDTDDIDIVSLLNPSAVQDHVSLT